jgi:antitoxin (DNA-binding transcriptional repressor) of toxin-antitoxin stability system
MINRLSATNAARNFSDLINRVRYQGASFEIERGNEVIARIIPTTPSATFQSAQLYGLPSTTTESGWWARWADELLARRCLSLGAADLLLKRFRHWTFGDK